MRRQVLYFIQCNGPKGPVKVGIAVDPNRRLSELRIGCPYPMVLLGTVAVADAAAEERRLHNKLRPVRVHGEWFRWSREVAREVDVAKAQARAVSESILRGIRP